MDDKQIIALFLARSEDAIEESAKKYGAYCRSIAFHILQNEADTDECLNDTYHTAWNRIPPHIPNNLAAFLGKITRNIALRRYEKENALKRGGGETDLIFEELAECLISENDTETALSETLARDAINRFLRSLPTKKRKIFLRRYWYMSEIAEIAEDFHMTKSAVKTSLLRMREALYEHLIKEGILDETK